MICARCGKEFRVTSMGWGYAYSGLLVCSYSCMRAMEKEDAEVTEDDKKKVDELSTQGLDNAQISEELNLSRQQVSAYLSRKRRDLEGPKSGTETDKDTPDDLKLMAIRLMGDMMEILKRIV